MIMHRYFKKPLFKDIWNCITQEKIKKIPQIPHGLMNFCFFFLLVVNYSGIKICILVTSQDKSLVSFGGYLSCMFFLYCL